MMDAASEFFKAIQEKDKDRVLKLLETGIDPNVSCSNNSYTALHYAVSQIHNEEMINLLLEYGAIANSKIVAEAIGNDYGKDITEKLLQHGANVKELLDYNNNLLHGISNRYRGGGEICELLIKYGVEVNQESKVCRITPLWNAVDNNNCEVIDILLQNGAQPCREMDAPMGKGVPLEYAFSLPEPTIKNLIKYAALQVNHSDDKELHAYFSYFSNNRISRERSKPYLRFAQDCMAEINSLKKYDLDNKDSTLFGFIISQGDTLEMLQGNTCVTNLVFDYISLFQLPIYCEVIMKKLKKSVIVKKVLKDVVIRNKVELNTYCVEQILKYLSRVDLWNLFLAYKATY